MYSPEFLALPRNSKGDVTPNSKNWMIGLGNCRGIIDMFRVRICCMKFRIELAPLSSISVRCALWSPCFSYVISYSNIPVLNWLKRNFTKQPCFDQHGHIWFILIFLAISLWLGNFSFLLQFFFHFLAEFERVGMVPAKVCKFPPFVATTSSDFGWGQSSLLSPYWSTLVGKGFSCTCMWWF